MNKTNRIFCACRHSCQLLCCELDLGKLSIRWVTRSSTLLPLHSLQSRWLHCGIFSCSQTCESFVGEAKPFKKRCSAELYKINCNTIFKSVNRRVGSKPSTIICRKIFLSSELICAIELLSIMRNLTAVMEMKLHKNIPLVQQYLFKSL